MSPARHPSAPAGGDPEQRLLGRAIGGVIRSAQDGELPLFAWTLGLPQSTLSEVVSYCFPELGALKLMPARQYQAILQSVPVEHGELVSMLLAGRSTGPSMQHAGWLAHAIAAAAMGSRHLWQDMGLGERAALSALLQHYFEPLYRRNTGNLKWKRFLFTELATLLGKASMQAPGCAQCPQFPVCFPLSG